MSALKESISKAKDRLEDLLDFVERFEDELEVHLENATEEVVVIFKPRSEIAVARIDGRRLTFDAQGKGSMMVESGRHALTWNIYGQPGQSYKIAIADPESARWDGPDNSKIGEDRKAYGYHEFTV